MLLIGEYQLFEKAQLVTYNILLYYQTLHGLMDTMVLITGVLLKVT